MKLIKRWIKIVAGFFVLILGIILMPVPGPGGTPVALAGLAILASELPFAQKLKEKFLAFISTHCHNAHPWKRFALIAGALALYAVTFTTFWWIYKART